MAIVYDDEIPCRRRGLQLSHIIYATVFSTRILLYCSHDEVISCYDFHHIWPFPSRLALYSASGKARWFSGLPLMMYGIAAGEDEVGCDVNKGEHGDDVGDQCQRQ